VIAIAHALRRSAMPDQDTSETKSRLQQHVAEMTRRTHLLGLACGSASLTMLAGCEQLGSPSGAAATEARMDACVRLPEETNGPYPADGTNRANGSMANILLTSGIVRQDMRSSFAGMSGTATGVKLDLGLKLVNVTQSCAPLVGYAVYVWHCTDNGEYSLYTLPEQNFLRAVGVSDAAGNVQFTTIYPGCYRGRLPHIHFEVYPSLSEADAFSNRVLCSQIAFPNDLSASIYKSESGYASSIEPFQEMSRDTDNVFGDNTAAELAAQTAKLKGSIATGYVGGVTVGIDPTAEPVMSRPPRPGGPPRI
jgi:protocatechuate 3,4-dioxygenase beta subunit